MSATLDELERLLAITAAEQRKLIALLLKQRDAMRQLRADEIERLVAEQEQSRMRLAGVEPRRRATVLAAARELKLPPSAEPPSLAQLAEACPDPLRRARLTVARSELRELSGQLAQAGHVVGRLSGAVLGHLNVAMRILKSAMRDAGTYTRNGAPGRLGRLGAMEVVG
jgi:hypothetical protein